MPISWNEPRSEAQQSGVRPSQRPSPSQQPPPQQQRQPQRPSTPMPANDYHDAAFDEDQFLNEFEVTQKARVKSDYWESVDEWSQDSQSWLQELGVNLEVCLLTCFRFNNLGQSH